MDNNPLLQVVLIYAQQQLLLSQLFPAKTHDTNNQTTIMKIKDLEKELRVSEHTIEFHGYNRSATQSQSTAYQQQSKDQFLVNQKPKSELHSPQFVLCYCQRDGMNLSLKGPMVLHQLCLPFNDRPQENTVTWS